VTAIFTGRPGTWMSRPGRIRLGLGDSVSLVICNTGLVKLLQQKLAYLATLKVDLFITNITPGQTDTLATYSGHTPTAPWYAQQTFGTWGTAFLNADAPPHGETDCQALTIWTPTDITHPTPIYGYFVTDPNAGSPILIWAEKDPAGPKTLGANLVPYVLQGILLESQFGP
jgi:hypothetical protein